MSTLAERFVEITKDLPRGWQADLARACKIKPPSVANWVSGKAKSIEAENLLIAAKFLNVNPVWLATGKGEKNIGSSHPYAEYLLEKFNQIDKKSQPAVLAMIEAYVAASKKED